MWIEHRFGEEIQFQGQQKNNILKLDLRTFDSLFLRLMNSTYLILSNIFKNIIEKKF